MDPYGGEYLQFKKNQYEKQKATIGTLYRVNTILIVEAIFLIFGDLYQFMNYNEETNCYPRGFERNSSKFILYFVISRLMQSLTGPVIAIIIFWRRKVRKLSKMEIMERKRKILEENLECKC